MNSFCPDSGFFQLIQRYSDATPMGPSHNVLEYMIKEERALLRSNRHRFLGFLSPQYHLILVHYMRVNESGQ